MFRLCGKSLISSAFQAQKKMPMMIQPSIILCSRIYNSPLLNNNFNHATQRFYTQTNESPQTLKDELTKIKSLLEKTRLLADRTTYKGERDSAEEKIKILLNQIDELEQKLNPNSSTSSHSSKESEFVNHNMTLDLIKSEIQKMAEDIIKNCLTNRKYDDALAIIKTIDPGANQDRLLLDLSDTHMLDTEWSLFRPYKALAEMQRGEKKEKALEDLAMRYCTKTNDIFKHHKAHFTILEMQPSERREKALENLIAHTYSNKDYVNALKSIKTLKDSLIKDDLLSHFSANEISMINYYMNEKKYEEALVLIQNMKPGSQKDAFSLDLSIRLGGQDPYQALIALKALLPGDAKENALHTLFKTCLREKKYIYALWTVEVMKPGSRKEIALQELADQAYANKDYVNSLKATKMMVPGNIKSALLINFIENELQILNYYTKEKKYDNAFEIIQNMQPSLNRDSHLINTCHQAITNNSLFPAKAMIKYLGAGEAQSKLLQSFLDKCYEMKNYPLILSSIQDIMKPSEDKEEALENLAYKSYSSTAYKVCLEAIDAMQPGERKNRLLELTGNKSLNPSPLKGTFTVLKSEKPASSKNGFSSDLTNYLFGNN